MLTMAALAGADPPHEHESRYTRVADREDANAGPTERNVPVDSYTGRNVPEYLS